MVQLKWTWLVPRWKYDVQFTCWATIILTRCKSDSGRNQSSFLAEIPYKMYISFGVFFAAIRIDTWIISELFVPVNFARFFLATEEYARYAEMGNGPFDIEKRKKNTVSVHKLLKSRWICCSQLATTFRVSRILVQGLFKCVQFSTFLHSDIPIYLIDWG